MEITYDGNRYYVTNVEQLSNKTSALSKFEINVNKKIDFTIWLLSAIISTDRYITGTYYDVVIGNITGYWIESSDGPLVLIHPDNDDDDGKNIIFFFIKWLTSL